MLLSLHIENLAIVESAEVRFGPGLNVLSGETGAGKSVVLGALALCLGGRASAEMVRTGAASAVVEARFRPGARARAALDDLGVEAGEVLALRRLVAARGPGRAWIDGQPATLAVLQQLGAALVDVAGQHDQHGLLDPDEHLRFLDAGAEAEPEQTAWARAWVELRAARQELCRLESRAKSADERAAWLRYQLQELEALALGPDEHAALTLERRILQHAAELASGTRAAEALLYSGEHAALDRLDAARAALRRLAGIDPAFEALASALDEARYQVEDVASGLRARARVGDAAPGRLDAVEARLDDIERVCRKHRCGAAELVERRAALAAELAEIEDLDEALGRAGRRLDRAGVEALGAAEALQRRRRAAATRLEREVTGQLTGLAMPHARFRVQLLPVLEGEEVNGALLGERGLDRAEFLLSANPGEDPRPLHRVASGGELSRVLLAIKLALRGADAAPTFVADEIDAGLGGRAAGEVGARLVALASEAQVLCVTHLPQIAGLADTHLGVEKRVHQGRTLAELRPLHGEARVAELARMLGGQDPAAEAWAAQVVARRRVA